MRSALRPSIFLLRKPSYSINTPSPVGMTRESSTARWNPLFSSIAFMRCLLTCQYGTLKKDSPKDNGADTVNKVRTGKRKAPVSGGPVC